MPEEPAKPGDFASLYSATVAPLRRYLARMLGNSTEAQDLAHDAYLRVYPTLQRKEAEKPEALLYVTARRLALNRIKRRQIAPFIKAPLDTDLASSQAPRIEDQVAARQDLELLQQALAQLPAGCRSVLLLRKVELLSHREIADRLGISVSTVEKQHARALRLLKQAMEESLGDESPFPCQSTNEEAHP
jgi:RNA polymerase sigma-70 factor (ECF subfamily)